MRKILSILLAVVLLCAALPVSALAVDVVDGQGGVIQIGIPQHVILGNKYQYSNTSCNPSELSSYMGKFSGNTFNSKTFAQDQEKYPVVFKVQSKTGTSKGSVNATIDKKVKFIYGENVDTAAQAEENTYIVNTGYVSFQTDGSSYYYVKHSITFSNGVEIDGANVTLQGNHSPFDNITYIFNGDIVVKNHGSLSIEGVKVVHAYNTDPSEYESWWDDHCTHIKLADGKQIIIDETSSVTINGATVEGKNSDKPVIDNKGSLSVTAKGSTASPSEVTNSAESPKSPTVQCAEGSTLNLTDKSTVTGSGDAKGVELAHGATVTTDAVNNLTVGENVAEAYVDNAGNVIQKMEVGGLPSMVDEVETKEPEFADDITSDDRTALKESIKESKIEGLPTDVQNELAKEDAAADNAGHAKQELKKEVTDLGDDQEVFIHVLTTVETKVEKYDAKNGVLTLDITPYYEVVATTQADKDKIVLPEEAGGDKTVNAVALTEKTELKVTKEVTMTIKVPESFKATGGGTVAVLHEHDGIVSRYDGTYSSSDKTVTFTNPDGFSTFTLVVLKQNMLKDLKSSGGTMEGFNPGKTDYTVNVPNSVTELTLTATRMHINSKVSASRNGEELTLVDGPKDDQQHVWDYTITVDNLEVGENKVTISVAYDGQDPTAYTVTIVRAAYVPPAYSVKAEAAENAEVKLSATSAAAGSKVTVTVTAGENYHVSGLTVTGANGKTVDVTDNEDGTYTFTMPASNVTVAAEVYECPSLAFPDIDLTEWYHEYVDYAIAHNLMRGIDVGVFAPEKTVTRAEMAGILWNLEGQPEVEAEIPFPDVPEDEWYTEAIRWAASAGVISGCGDGTFKPTDTITREQMAAMLYNYEQKLGGGGFTGDWMFNLPFDDVADISDWAFEAVAWCSMKGVITGDNNKFNPADTSKRAQLAAILALYDQLAK